MLREISERIKRLKIVMVEIELAAATGSPVELPVGYWQLVVDCEEGL